MKKWLKKLALVGALLMSNVGLMGQNSFYTDRAVASFPVNHMQVLIPISYGSVRVCTSADINTSTTPCPHLASIFDLSGTPLVVLGGNFGQVVTDVVGRFSFGCTPGAYQVQVAPTGSNTPQLNYPITCTSTTGGLPPVNLATQVTGVLPTANGGTSQNSTATFPTSGTVETGTGTTNTVSKFTNGASGVQGNAGITDDGTTIKIPSEAFTSGAINSVLWVDGTKYTTLAGCYADLPVGGTCHVIPGYTETLASSLTLSKNNAGFVFEGSATITMGSNQIIVGQNVTGAFIIGQSILGGAGFGSVLPATGLNFVYTGNGTAIVTGGANPTAALRLEKFYVDLTGAGNTAIGIDLINAHGGFRVQDVYVNGKGGAITQAGLQFNDGGTFTADGVVEHNWFSNLGIGINCVGNIQEISFLNNIMFAGATNSTGFNVNCAGGGNGSYIWGNTVSAYTTGYNFSANASAGWEVHANGNSNTTDIALANGASNNNIFWDNSQVGPIISDSSTATSNNHVHVAGYNGLLNDQPSAGALTGNSGDQPFYTYTLPALALPPGKCLDIETWGNHNAGTPAAVVLKIFFGATPYVNNTTTATLGQVYLRVHVCNNLGSITAQHGSSYVNYPGVTLATQTFAPLTSAEATSSAVVIKGTFNAANTEQFTPGAFVVRMSN